LIKQTRSQKISVHKTNNFDLSNDLIDPQANEFEEKENKLTGFTQTKSFWTQNSPHNSNY